MKNKTLQYGLMACLISAAILIDTARAQPKVSAANRETIRIMKTIKIPPPYTPVYQPYVQQRYLPAADATPDYSPKVGPIQSFTIPASTVVAPSVLPATATNTMSASITNLPVADKAAKTSSSTTTSEKTSVISKPVDKTPSVEKK